jgi:lysophospholipase L1-like esterase
MRDYFSDSAVGIVYIPSVLSTYEIVSPQVSIQSYQKRAPTYPASLVRPRSDAICAKIGEIAARNHIPFVDARPALRKVATTRVIHGPADWGHLNREGYGALAEAALELLDRMGVGDLTKKTP